MPSRLFRARPVLRSTLVGAVRELVLLLLSPGPRERARLGVLRQLTPKRLRRIRVGVLSHSRGTKGTTLGRSGRRKSVVRPARAERGVPTPVEFQGALVHR